MPHAHGLDSDPLGHRPTSLRATGPPRSGRSLDSLVDGLVRSRFDPRREALLRSLLWKDGFGMIGTEVPTVGGIPDDRPIVHPFSIYETDGQIGVARGI